MTTHSDPPAGIAAESERAIEPFRTFLFVPKHQAEWLADITRVWTEGLQMISAKQAEVAQAAIDTAARTTGEMTRAATQLTSETLAAIYRGTHERN
jgi:hypothetical protein